MFKLDLSCVQELKNYLTCPKCGNITKNPRKLFNCQHIICQECLNSSRFKCPKCHCMFSDIDITQPDFYIDHMLHLVNQIEADFGGQNYLIKDIPLDFFKQKIDDDEGQDNINSDCVLWSQMGWYVCHELGPNPIRRVAHIMKCKPYGATPLHIACQKGILNDVQELIAKGIDINVTNSANWTPLHLAVQHQMVQCVELLLSKGALVNVTEEYYRTPLYLAVKMANKEIVEMLLQYGADKNFMDYSGLTPKDIQTTTCVSDLLKKTKPKDVIPEQSFYYKPGTFIFNLNVDKPNIKLLSSHSYRFTKKTHTNDIFLCALGTSVPLTHPYVLKFIAQGIMIIRENDLENYLSSGLPYIPDLIPRDIRIGLLKSIRYHLEKKPRLFDGINFYIFGHDKPIEIKGAQFSKDDLHTLIEAAGGTILIRAPNKHTLGSNALYPYHCQNCDVLKTCHNFIVYQEKDAPLLLYNMAKLKHISSHCPSNFRNMDTIGSECLNIQFTSTPRQQSPRQSSSSRGPTFLTSISRRRNRSSSSTTPPAKRRRRMSSNTSNRNSTLSSRMDQLETTSASLSSDSEDSQFVQISKGKKVKMVGKEYTHLRPKSKNGLYVKIIQNSTDLENVVNSWVCVYQSSHDEAISLLINLLINIMGYQTVEIDYTEQLDYIALRQNLEKRTNKIQGKLICLFRSKSSFAKTFIAACYAFFQNLVFACDQARILYDSTFCNTLLSFIGEMCKSNNRVIIITVCSIAINLSTHFLSVLKRVENKINSSGSSNSSICIQDSARLHTIIEKLFDHILFFSTLQDPKLHMLRLRSAEGFGVWMKKYPQFFITEQILNKLRKLILDEKASVRIAAIKSCIIIVKNEKFTEYIVQDLESFLKLYNTVAARLKDINVNVEIAAVKFFTKSSFLFPDMLTNDIKKKIFNRMYAYNYKLARECCLFCISAVFGPDRLQRMRNILKLNQVPQYEGLTEVLIHTLIGCTSEFWDIEFIIDLINTDINQDIKLLEIIYYMTNILVNGKLGYRRSEMSVGVDKNKMNDYIGSTILTKITFLFEHFSEDEESLVWILKTLNILDITQPTFSSCREHIKNMVKYLIEIMKDSLNKTILSLTSQILSKFSDETCPYSGQYYAIFLAYLDQLISQYQTLSRKQDIESDYRIIRNIIYILSIISEHHNCVNLLDWNNIYFNLGSDNSEILKYQMIYCQHYLKWELKNLDEVTEEESILCLKECIEDFLTSSIVILKSSRVESLSISTYLTVCEFFLEYNKVKIQPQANNLIENLGIGIYNYRGLAEVIELFVVNHCFSGDADNLFSRKTYLLKYVTLLMIGVIKIEKLVLVMKHYNSFKDDYKSIYQLIFDKLSGISHQKLNYCIFKTLLTLYLENENRKLLKELAVDFANVQPKSKRYHIIEIGILHIIRNNENLKFILVLKPFVEQLSRTVRLDILRFIQLNCPAEYYRDEAFILFLKALKLNNVGDHFVPQVPESETQSFSGSIQSFSFAETSEDNTIMEIDD